MSARDLLALAGVAVSGVFGWLIARTSKPHERAAAETDAFRAVTSELRQEMARLRDALDECVRKHVVALQRIARLEHEVDELRAGH